MLKMYASYLEYNAKKHEVKISFRPKKPCKLPVSVIYRLQSPKENLDFQKGLLKHPCIWIVVPVKRYTPLELKTTRLSLVEENLKKSELVR